MRATMKIHAIFVLSLIAGLCSGQNLVSNGDFETAVPELSKIYKGRGRLSFVKEEIGDNHCAKVEIVNFTKDKDGIETAAANILVPISNVKAGKTYCFSFEATGSAPRFLLLVKQKDVDLKVTMPPKIKKGTYIELTPDWKEYTGTFVAKNDGDCVMNISLWHSTRYGKLFYSIGDYALVDNIEVFEKR